VIRHDMWDRDLPAPPSLVTVRREGREIDAVAQITRAGMCLYSSARPAAARADRRSEVPQEAVDGEVPAKSEPLPLSPRHSTRQKSTKPTSPIARPRPARRRWSDTDVKKGSQFMRRARRHAHHAGLRRRRRMGRSTWDPEPGCYT